MMGKLKELYKKYKEQILYVIFGGLTTLVDWAVSFPLYALLKNVISTDPWVLHLIDVLAWAAAVAFAYCTNRKWVFESKRTGFLPILCELAGFAGGRVFTFLLQEGIMLIFVTWLGLNAYLFRILTAVAVIVLNYIISKLLVFRKKNQ